MLTTNKNKDRFITSHSNAPIPIFYQNHQKDVNPSTYEHYIKNNILSSSRLLNYSQKQ